MTTPEMPPQTTATTRTYTAPGKEFTTVWLLSLLLGHFGVDRFYLGKIGTGIIKLVTIGGFGVWYLIDLIFILTGNTKDKNGAALLNEPQPKTKQWIISAAVLAVLILIGTLSNANTSASTETLTKPVPTEETIEKDEELTEVPEVDEPVIEKPAETVTPAPTPPPAPAETMGQKNAKAKAADYLEFMPFSRQGLIEQLMYEGFSEADSIYGTDATGADWYQQAVFKAADYLDFTSFSRQGLIEQLMYEGFSQAEAEHGATQNGY